jgi:hypothetical protein
MKMKFDYWSPTPKRMRVLGDAMMTLSVSFTGLSVIDEYRWFCITMSILLGMGKFLTNWFSDESIEKRKEE